MRTATGQKLDEHIERVALEGRLAGNGTNADILLGSDKFRDSSERSEFLVLEAKTCTIEPEGRLVLELSTP